jgi:hypothetical protein
MIDGEQRPQQTTVDLVEDAVPVGWPILTLRTRPFIPDRRIIRMAPKTIDLQDGRMALAQALAARSAPAAANLLLSLSERDAARRPRRFTCC